MVHSTSLERMQAQAYASSNLASSAQIFTSSQPTARNLQSRTNFDDSLPGEYWTTDIEKARRYSDFGVMYFRLI